MTQTVALPPGDKLRDQADELRADAEDLATQAARLFEQATEKRAEAFRLDAKADRLDDPSKSARITQTALGRARADGLLARAGVAVEDLPSIFEAGDLAAALNIDAQRATRLLLALAELEKVARTEGGWTLFDPDEARVRDFIVQAGTFTFADAMAALELPEMDVSAYLADFKARGFVENGGAQYRYVKPSGRTPAREDRRPPEQDPPAFSEAPARGFPIRVVHHGKRGAQMSGGARHRMKLRDQRREAMDAAREARAEAQRQKAKRNAK
jgi:hypothetical protein